MAMTECDVVVNGVAVLSALTTVLYGLYTYNLLGTVASWFLPLAGIALIIAVLALIVGVVVVAAAGLFFAFIFKTILEAILDDCLKKKQR